MCRAHIAVWLSATTRMKQVLFRTCSGAASGRQRHRQSRPDFQIVEPVTHETLLARCSEATRQLVDRAAATAKGARPILVFEFIPGDTAPGSSEFGACYDLASLISSRSWATPWLDRRLRAATAERLRRFACGGVHRDRDGGVGVSGADHARGPDVRPGASRSGRFPGDPQDAPARLCSWECSTTDADLRVARTADRAVHYVLAENMQEFLKTHNVTEERATQDIAGARGILPAGNGQREEGCICTAATSRKPGRARRSIHQPRQPLAVDREPTLGQSARAEWIKLEGLLDNVAVSFLSRKIEDARQQKKNLFILEIDSPGGTEAAGDRMADILAEIKDMKTVAYVNERALGIAALLPLACRDIVLKKGSNRAGDVRQTVSGRNGLLHDLNDTARAGLAKKAALWAQARKGHPDAVAVHDESTPTRKSSRASDSVQGASRLILHGKPRSQPRPGTESSTPSSSPGVRAHRQQGRRREASFEPPAMWSAGGEER